ncbi:MAG: cytochrome C [Candidatus Marinimicrobia bacterium]|jgi:hydroxylamine dehydrogenase|nr:cytochrome C [Candidatus Neomarinimicrobiota bacterium]MBT3633171.1 cytochrome C [Candidatus Neomarinimicrobiota bacterium]MBT3682228.1 cytochrome C [Candidatus Neomarinimicrobiota bacterium]MBT3758771.1 cytochrome C [Candidatus Neomarinimicrobiota bacterium]MBT3895355.1 cytochrome C [Candidatus Neomarinimicrobiota bacterium]
MRYLRNILITAMLASITLLYADTCTDCHKEIQPGIVTDWEISAHSENDIGCDVCHGEEHQNNNDVEKVEFPTPETCAECHEEKVEQFSKGKHALAWAAMEAMPTTHWKPMELIEGQKGCGGCHKIGMKSKSQIENLRKNGNTYGNASCDACHTRHTFSLKEARQPQACQTCHMGFDHPQWEMYSSSKHGVRYLLKQNGILPENTSAPTCQDCHMPDGDHEVRTAWGFLAVRTDGLAPYPGEDAEWWANRVTILQALGVLDPEGKPTGRLDVVANAQVARLTAEGFDVEREKMIKVCMKCHSENYSRGELKKGDDLIKAGDALLAEAIRIIADLYEKGLLVKPDTYLYNFPDLLTFHDAPTPIEQKLFVMHLKHRMRLFQGAFHNNPDYSLWYGWNEMVMDLSEIKAIATELYEEYEENRGFFSRLFGD